MDSRKEMRKALVEIDNCTKCPHMKYYGGWADHTYWCKLSDKEITSEKDISKMSTQEIMDAFFDDRIEDNEIPSWCPKLVEEKVDIEWIAER
jgi:hypothetical protein